MFDRERVIEVAFADDDVEPAASVADAVPGEVLSGQTNHPRLLPGVDGVHSSPVRSGAPGLHLHEHQQLAHFGDEIELPQPSPMVPYEDAIALPEQPALGFRFTGLPEHLTPM